ncbi:MAG: hypothetical protein JNK82_26705 [Myxococcaceae bacterium]|nr:hypothetical protein [Myxococcaceae bacterium]
MPSLAVLFVFHAATTVSLTLDPGLSCPKQASLAERFARVGLTVRSEAPTVANVLQALPAFEVSVKPTAEGLLLAAKRTSDGKVFERPLQQGKEDCPTLERLVVVLIHSWINAKMPVLSPAGGKDGGTRR